MKNILNAVIDEARNLVITPSEGFAGEHNAEVLEIDIGPFAAGDYDYFILNFENFCADGKLISNVISTENDEPSYIANGVIYCPLTAQLTASGRLRIQLEAHKNSDGEEIVKKSSVAELSFKPSVMGEQDMMNSGGSIYSRLEAIEDNIDAVENNAQAVENRVQALENQSYGAKIKAADEKAQGAHTKADALDGRVDVLETENAQTKERISVVEDYKIPESFEAVENRVKALEDRPDGLKEIPLATAKTVGGVKMNTISPVSIDEDGALWLNYEMINHYAIAALFVLALVNEAGNVETISGQNCDSVSSFVYDCSMSIASDTLTAVAFTSFTRGTVEYMTSGFENAVINVESNHVYVISKKDGVTQVDDYFGTSLRRLIQEGI